MIHTISKIGIFAFVLGVFAIVAPVPDASAARFGDGDTCASSFLGIPAWYDGLPRDPSGCNVRVSEATTTDGNGKTVEDPSQGDLSSFIFRIALNIIELALWLIGYLAVGFIIYGGFKYLTSAGSADRITAGRKIIQNAVIGLVISFFSVAIVNFIASNIS